MDATINTLAQLGGTVFTVCAFLYYLDKNQTKQIEANIQLALALDNLTQKICSNSVSNRENTIATDKNTKAM